MKRLLILGAVALTVAGSPAAFARGEGGSAGSSRDAAPAAQQAAPDTVRSRDVHASSHVVPDSRDMDQGSGGGRG